MADNNGNKNLGLGVAMIGGGALALAFGAAVVVAHPFVVGAVVVGAVATARYGNNLKK